MPACQKTKGHGFLNIAINIRKSVELFIVLETIKQWEQFMGAEKRLVLHKHTQQGTNEFF